MRLRIVLGVAGLILVLAAIGAAASGGKPTATIDPQAGPKLASNLAARCQSPAPTWCAALASNPVQIINATANIYFVSGSSPIGSPTQVLQICQDIAAMLNDRDTGRPLGLQSVTIRTTTGDTVVLCFPPTPGPS